MRIEDDWELDGASDHRVSEALYLTDPEGNGIEIYRDTPREGWPSDEDGRVEMETLPLDVDELREESTGTVDPDATETVPPGTVIGHVHLEVSSIPAAREFYARTMGLQVRQEFGPSALFLAADDYHHHIGVNTWNGRTEPAEGRGLAWFELVVPDRKRTRNDTETVRRTGYRHGSNGAGTRCVGFRFNYRSAPNSITEIEQLYRKGSFAGADNAQKSVRYASGKLVNCLILLTYRLLIEIR